MDKFLTQLRENWVILLFMGSVIMSWTMFSARLADAEQKIQDLQTIVSEINQININVAVIQEQISTINKKLQYSPQGKNSDN